MKYYYTGYSCVGWIPNPEGGGEWRYFANDREYKEAYAEALCPLIFFRKKNSTHSEEAITKGGTLWG